MPKYRIVISECAAYEIELEAKSETAAAKRAEKLFLENIKIDGGWTCDVRAREVEHVELLTGKQAD